MAASPSYLPQLDVTVPSSSNDYVRTHFQTREGVYRLMKLSEYSRPSRTTQNGVGNIPFRVAFVSAPDAYGRRVDDVLSFIVGKELYVYYYYGVRKVCMPRCRCITDPLIQQNK
jgi:WD repeat-containing protein 20